MRTRARPSLLLLLPFAIAWLTDFFVSFNSLGGFGHLPSNSIFVFPPRLMIEPPPPVSSSQDTLTCPLHPIHPFIRSSFNIQKQTKQTYNANPLPLPYSQAISK
jgi:hypothetical protein